MCRPGCAAWEMGPRPAEACVAQRGPALAMAICVALPRAMYQELPPSRTKQGNPEGVASCELALRYSKL